MWPLSSLCCWNPSLLHLYLNSSFLLFCFFPRWRSAFIRPPAIFVFPKCKSNPATLLHRLHHLLTGGMQGPPWPDSPTGISWFTAPLVVQTLRALSTPSTGTDCFLAPCCISLNISLFLRSKVQFRLPLPGSPPAFCGCSSRRAPRPVSRAPWHAHPTLFTGDMAAASATPEKMISTDVLHPSLFSSLNEGLTQRKHRRNEGLRRTLWHKLPHLCWRKLNTGFSRTIHCSLLPCNRV